MMVRKTREAALATREALIDAAEQVFRREGVTRTSLAEIAAEAGVTRGAIYWHFRDKAELLDALCERTLLPLDAAFARSAQAARTDALLALRTLAVEALAKLASDPRTRGVFEILFHKCELVGELAERSAAQQNDRRACLASVESLFELAVASGQLPAHTDTRLATRMLHAYMIGLMREWVLDPADYDLAVAAPAMIDTFIAGLRNQPPCRAAVVARASEAAEPDR